jgi:hypothetical protein
LNKSPTIKEGRSRGGKFTKADGTVTPAASKEKLKGAGKLTKEEVEKLQGLTGRALIAALEAGDYSGATLQAALKALAMFGETTTAGHPKKDSLIDEMPDYSGEVTEPTERGPSAGVHFDFDHIPKDN